MSIITLIICNGHADDKRKPQQIKMERERKQLVYTGRAVDPQTSKFEANSLKKYLKTQSRGTNMTERL